MAKKTVKIKESDLVTLIENILTEAIGVKKKEWLSEQKNSAAEKLTLLEGEIAKLKNELTKK